MKAQGSSRGTLRHEHAELTKRIEALRHTLGALAGMPPLDRRAAIDRAVVFLDDEIRPHASWEEVRLYPAVDRALGGATPFTAELRKAHDAIDARIDELALLATRAEPDAGEFTRLAGRIFGALEAHFREEERVLVPVVDRLSPDVLRDAVGTDPAAAHG